MNTNVDIDLQQLSSNTTDKFEGLESKSPLPNNSVIIGSYVVIFLGIVGLVANLHAFRVLTKRQFRRQQLNTILITLVIHDFLIMVRKIVTSISYLQLITIPWNNRNFIYYLGTYFKWETTGAVRYVTVVISIQRFCGIVFPHQFKQFLDKSHPWKVTGLLMLFVFSLTGIHSYLHKIDYHAANWMTTIFWDTIPLTLVILINLAAIKKLGLLFHQRMNTNGFPKPTKMLGIVAIVFIICQLPTVIKSVIGHFFGYKANDLLMNILFQTTQVAFTANSAANVAVYVYMSPQYHNTFVNLLPLMCRPNIATLPIRLEVIQTEQAHDISPSLEVSQK